MRTHIHAYTHLHAYTHAFYDSTNGVIVIGTSTTTSNTAAVTGFFFPFPCSHINVHPDCTGAQAFSTIQVLSTTLGSTTALNNSATSTTALNTMWSTLSSTLITTVSSTLQDAATSGMSVFTVAQATSQIFASIATNAAQSMTTGAQSQLLGSMLQILSSSANASSSSSSSSSSNSASSSPLDLSSGSDMLVAAGAVMQVQNSSESGSNATLSTISQVHQTASLVLQQLLTSAVPNQAPTVIQNSHLSASASRGYASEVVGTKQDVAYTTSTSSESTTTTTTTTLTTEVVQVAYPSSFATTTTTNTAAQNVPDTVDTQIVVFPSNTYPTSGAFSSAASSVSSLVSVTLLAAGSSVPLSITDLASPFVITVPLHFSEEQSIQARSIQLLMEIDEQKVLVSAFSLNSTWSRIQSSLAIKACNAPGTGATASPALEMAMGCPNVTRLSTSQYTDAALGRSVWALTVRLEYQYEPVLDGWFERVVNSQESLWSSMSVVKVVPDTTNSGGAYRPRCQYWDEVSSGWSTRGLTSTVDFTALTITCQTTHLTSFGAVMQWNSVSVGCKMCISSYEYTSTCAHAQLALARSVSR